jgi:hypothetical protein
MGRIYRTVGILVVSVVAALSVNSQETTKDQSKDPAITSSQTASKDYVFPSSHERFKRYVNSTIGPLRLARTAASAGIQQWRDSPEEWGQGARGYSKRFASGLAQNAIHQTVEYGLDEAMDVDTGFQRSKREGFFPRFKDALIQNVTSRKRNGDRVISVPRFAGVYTGAIVARETWYPDHTYKDGLRSGTTTLLTGFGINLVREFVINW